MGNSFLAITYAIICYSLLNIGLVLEKKGASELPAIESQSFIQNLKNFLTNKTWLIGFILTNIQWIFLALAMNEGSLSLVSPFLGVGLVVLIIFAYFYLKEPISGIELIGIFAVIIGVVILGITNPPTEPTYTLEQMNSFLAKPESIIFLVIVGLLIVFPTLYTVGKGFLYADIIFGFVSGLFMGLGTIFTKAVMTGVDFSDIGSSLGAAAVTPLWYIYIIIFVGSNASSMVVQQIGFQKGKATTVTTIATVLGLVTPVAGGLIIFGDWNGLPAGIITAKVAAIIIISVGVAILSFFGSASITAPEPNNNGKSE